MSRIRGGSDTMFAPNAYGSFHVGVRHAAVIAANSSSQTYNQDAARVLTGELGRIRDKRGVMRELGSRWACHVGGRTHARGEGRSRLASGCASACYNGPERGARSVAMRDLRK